MWSKTVPLDNVVEFSLSSSAAIVWLETGLTMCHYCPVDVPAFIMEETICGTGRRLGHGGDSVM